MKAIKWTGETYIEVPCDRLYSKILLNRRDIIRANDGKLYTIHMKIDIGTNYEGVMFLVEEMGDSTLREYLESL